MLTCLTELSKASSAWDNIWKLCHRVTHHVSPCNHQDTVYVHAPFFPSSRGKNNSPCLLIFLMLLQLVSCRFLSQPFAGEHGPSFPQRQLWSIAIISPLLARSPRQHPHCEGLRCPVTAQRSAELQACRQRWQNSPASHQCQVLGTLYQRCRVVTGESLWQVHFVSFSSDLTTGEMAAPFSAGSGFQRKLR